tara:strand:- start:427 stop:1344 length:918 start_codon:yes stop_codon:yes gene_type:complete
MRRKIAILAGGYSKEREISFSTAKEVFKVLKKKYNVILIDPKINLLSKLKKFKPDIVFNALHGRYGEDGYIQSILETAKIKYTHSGVKSSSIAIDKELSKKIFKKNKILTPTGFRFQYKEELNYNLLIKKISKNLGYPVVLKPVNEGSSVGVFICNKSNVLRNLIKLRDFDEILVEKYIPGREIQSAILGKKAIGSIELIPKRKFYDYKAKYNKRANTKHVMPARLSIKKYREVNRIALKAHRLLNCRGVSRSDFRFYKNKFYLLELNTQPGMTSLSLVPEIARYINIDFNQLIEELIKDASINK